MGTLTEWVISLINGGHWLNESLVNRVIDQMGTLIEWVISLINAVISECVIDEWRSLVE